MRPELRNPVLTLRLGPMRRPPPHLTITHPIHCQACWYDLRGLPCRGRCPECGTMYDAFRRIRHDDAAAIGHARRRRYMRTITHVSIVSPLDFFRAIALIFLLLATTGAASLIIWFIWKSVR